MAKYENRQDVDVMIHPTRPEEWKSEFNLNFYENTEELNDSDIIVMNKTSPNQSAYKITKIVERRDGAMERRKYVTAKAIRLTQF